MSASLIDHTDDSRPLNRVFDVLSHHYRRRILALVDDHDPHVKREFDVEDLATEDDELEFLETELYHVHLPKLAEAGYIEWNEEAQKFWRGPAFEEIAPLFRLLDEYQDELPDARS